MTRSDPPPEGSFAALFESQPQTVPRRRNVRVGDRVEATVVQVGKDSVFVELDGKRQAFIDAVELRAPDGTLAVQVGDRIAGHVVETDERTGQVRIGRSMGRSSGLGAVEQALATGVPIEGKVTAVNKGGLEVDVAGTRAFCPMSQVDTRFVQDPSAYVGQSLRFVVTQVKDARSVVLSRRAVLEREAEASPDVKDVGAIAEAAKDAGPKIEVGAVVEGVVDRIERYGVFVQVSGIKGRAGRGLVPAVELGVPSGTDLRRSFPEGTKLKAKVLDVGEGKLRLSVRGAKDAEERAHFEEARGKAQAPGSLGTLGDLLKKRR